MIPDALKAHLRMQTDPATGAYLFAAVAIDGPGGADVFLTGRTHPEGAARNRHDLMHHRVRVASISKTVTARILAGLATNGVLDLEVPVFDLLHSHGYPDWLNDPKITSASLLSHTSGIRDANGYIPEDGESLPEFLHRLGQVPGTAPDYFFYSNLGLIIAGAVAEAASGRRFDDLATDVLRPLGIHGGFNWSTVKPEERAMRLPLYQRRGASYPLTADGPGGDWSADLIWRNGIGVDLDTYTLE